MAFFNSVQEFKNSCNCQGVDGKREFNGLIDVYVKTVRSDGVKVRVFLNGE